MNIWLKTFQQSLSDCVKILIFQRLFCVFRFQSGPVFRATAPNYFAPSQWKQYDDDDIDLCGSEPVVLDLPGQTSPVASAGLGVT